ncbi:hypothetical protein BJV74DRAFT_864589 [Russula compacta]|nr:hypothetical protein BJV74DRAFT_864589 [Russula compacta]
MLQGMSRPAYVNRSIFRDPFHPIRMVFCLIKYIRTRSSSPHASSAYNCGAHRRGDGPVKQHASIAGAAKTSSGCGARHCTTSDSEGAAPSSPHSKVRSCCSGGGHGRYAGTCMSSRVPTQRCGSAATNMGSTRAGYGL